MTPCGERCCLRALLAFLLLGIAGPRAVQAQQQNITRVVILPFQGSEQAGEVFGRFLAAMRTLPGVDVADQTETSRLLEGIPVTNVLKNPSELQSFASLTSLDYVVGGLVRDLDGGRVEVSALVYSREERRVRDVRYEVYADLEHARTGMEQFGRRLGHPRNFSPSDTPLIYSMLVPGLGQLASEEPVHAAVSAGLAILTAAYGLTTPSPDPFRWKVTDFTTEYDVGANDYRYFVRQLEVSRAEFFESLNTERGHHLRAEGDRRAAEVRKRRATGLFAAAYLFNLADTVFITRKPVDDSAFFVRVEGFIGGGSGLRGPVAGLHVRFRFP